ncbi:MAG: hypothetical protein IKI11_06570 [Neisseriaceae bacterium]|nr:hypothetical protein [Neisseriaceae bacterium]
MENNELTLEKFIALAVKVLESSHYRTQKDIIRDFFEKNNNIYARLAIVDTFYSTQMNKRLFGLDDLAKEIKEKIGTDEKLKEEVSKFKCKNKKDEKNKISELLKSDNKYGIRKNGEDSGHARSLISKYIYFVTDCKFPIEDTFVKDNINIILLHFVKNEIDNKNDILKEIIKFCDDNKIKYSEFDNLLWLFGKIKKGSLSLVVEKDDYIKIIEKLGLSYSNNKKESKKESEEFDKCMACKLNNPQEIEKIKDLISDDFYRFLIQSSKINSQKKKAKK